MYNVQLGCFWNRQLEGEMRIDLGKSIETIVFRTSVSGCGERPD